MNVEYDNFILARPGHNAKYNKDVSWDELKRIFSLYHRIPMIVAGADHFGPIDPNSAIGYVDATLDHNAQVVRGEPMFFKNTFEQLPVPMQHLLLNKKHVAASLGYEEFNNGMRKIDHIAIGVASPVFPDVGFNAESRFKYEETDGMNKDAKTATEPSKTVQFVTKEDFEKFSTKVLELLQHSQKSPPPEPVKAQAVEQEPKKETEAPPKEAPTTPRQAPPEVEPERIIPKGKSAPANDGWLVDENGRRYLSYPVAGREATRKGETT